VTSGHEDEFRRLFEQEAIQRLGALAEHALELERGSDDPELIASMFRHAHTLKGGAGIVGFGVLADVLHQLETLLEELRDGRRTPSPAVADAILGTVDALRDLLAREMAGQAHAPASPSTELVRAPVPAPVERRRPDRDRSAIPVPVERLDELVRLVGEGAAAQLRVGRLLSERLGDEPSTLDEYRELTRVLRDLQDRAMRARMVSVGSVAAPLRRATRDISRQEGKRVRFEVAGEDTELDRHVLERLREPLVALVRNAIGHGIEPPAERIEAGKPPEGVVRLHAMQIGGDVILSVEDDGRGIDAAGVRASAEGADPLAAIFEPGVSTAGGVSALSGRGVGLDVVRAAVEALRGRVDVHTVPGGGSEFRLSVPMTVAIQRCLIVEAGGRAYALPMHSAVGLLGPEAVGGMNVEGRPAVWFAGEAIGAADLPSLLADASDPARGPVAVVSTAAGRHAFRVDAVAGQRDVVVKDLGGLVPRLPLVAGASVETDGTVMLVLDPNGLLEAVAGALPSAPGPPELAPPAPAAPRARVLVVDDALTVRELERTILERAGYAVITAAGGREALERLADVEVDLVLTDVEMPDMDGFALTKAIRSDPALAGMPILVMTSRDADEYRDIGLELGADGYLLKREFDEHRVVTAVAQLLETRR
jgi:two-component system, chemotaxis family, sensor kinase CheA